MKIIIISLVFFILSSFLLLSNEIDFDVRGAISGNEIVSDSILIYESGRLVGRILNSNSIAFDALTNIESDIDTKISAIKIYNINGELLDILDSPINQNPSDILNSKPMGYYLIQYCVSDKIISSNIYLNLKEEKYQIRGLLNPNSIYDLVFYKNGYENIFVNGFDPSEYHDQILYYNPIFDKYYSSVNFSITGLSESGTSERRWTNNGVNNNDYRKITKSYKDSFMLSNTYERYPVGDCYQDVMLTEYEELKCSNDFDITKENFYLCQVSCDDEQYIKTFMGANLYIDFDFDRNVITRFQLTYKKGELEVFSYPAIDQEVNDVGFYFRDLPFVESGNKYIVEITNKTDLQNSLLYFDWKHFKYVSDYMPPYDYNSSRTNFFSETIISSSAKLFIEVEKK